MLLNFNLLYVYFHSECNFITIRVSFRNRKSLQGSFYQIMILRGLGRNKEILLIWSNRKKKSCNKVLLGSAEYHLHC